MFVKTKAYKHRRLRGSDACTIQTTIELSTEFPYDSSCAAKNLVHILLNFTFSQSRTTPVSISQIYMKYQICL